MMEKINVTERTPNPLSHSPHPEILENNLPSSINLVLDRKEQEIANILDNNRDLIEPGWENRHAKLIRIKGAPAYFELAHRAHKYGKNPRALMAALVDKALR